MGLAMVVWTGGTALADTGLITVHSHAMVPSLKAMPRPLSITCYLDSWLLRISMFNNKGELILYMYIIP